jgi:hypothetical protein
VIANVRVALDAQLRAHAKIDDVKGSLEKPTLGESAGAPFPQRKPVAPNETIRIAVSRMNAFDPNPADAQKNLLLKRAPENHRSRVEPG